MKKLILILLCFMSLNVFANEHIKVSSKETLEYHNHNTYEVWYDASKSNPAYVIWDLTAEQAKLSAKNSFRKTSWTFNKCGSAPNASNTYKNSGYDRGHMCPNEDRDISEEDAKNTFRGCNICPQTHKLNAGLWLNWEKEERSLAIKYDLVTIVSGPIYIKREKSFNGHIVPEMFFKIIIIDNKPNYVRIFTQENEITFSTIEEVEKLTGLTFN